MVISLKDSNMSESKRVTVDPNTSFYSADSNSSSSSYDSDENTMSSTNFALTSTNQNGETEVKVKRKRQRLTHLTHEEKVMRRKMKNRVAAQSARDRKKAKMDELDVNVALLREQNEKLKRENALLKEQNKMLDSENRLLKQKLTTQHTSAQVAAHEAERSAESSNVTQPKSQLQVQQQSAIMQKLIYVLIVQTLSLLKVTNQKSSQFAQLVQMKNALVQLDQHSHQLTANPKLRCALLKLLKLMRVLRSRYFLHSQLQQQNQLVSIRKHTTTVTTPMTEEHVKVALLISLVVKCLMKKSRN